MAYIGVDIGTERARVAVWKGSHVQKLMDEPTAICFPGDFNNWRVFGENAKRLEKESPLRTVTGFISFLSKPYSYDAVKRLAPMRAVDMDGQVGVFVKVTEKEFNFTAVELMAMYIAYIKKTVEEKLKEEIRLACLTIPCSFKDAERQAMLDAASAAGLKARLVNCTTAVAVAIKYRDLETPAQRIDLILDVGAGSSKCSVLKVTDHGNSMNLLSHMGSGAGGQAIEQAVLEHVGNLWNLDNVSPQALVQLKTSVQEALVTLESNSGATITSRVDDVCRRVALTRSRLDELIKEQLNEIMTTVELVLASANLITAEVDRVILTGGVCRNDQLQGMIRDFFQKEPQVELEKELGATGAALMAALATGQMDTLVINEVAAHSLQYQRAGPEGIPRSIVRSGRRIPKARKYSWFLLPNQAEEDLSSFTAEMELTEDGEPLLKAKFVADQIIPVLLNAVIAPHRIDFHFNVDDNGVLRVTIDCQDPGTDEISYSDGRNVLTPVEVSQLLSDEVVFANREAAQAKATLARNNLESSIIRIQLAAEQALERAREIHEDTMYWIQANTEATEQDLLDKMDQVNKTADKDLVSLIKKRRIN